jgi:hypothetical protein
VQRGHIPWAIIIEFQIVPDALMFGRLLGYGAQVWLELKPSEERGDRFWIGAIVVNLTGRGTATRVMEWPETGLFTALRPVEVNLGEMSAKAMLDRIAAGEATPVILPFIPLMQGGDDLAIIQQWIALASAEQDTKRRGDYGGLAIVLSEALGRRDIWKQALKGWNIMQSQQVLEWQAEARAEGEAKGRATALLRLLQIRHGNVPADLIATITAMTDLATLDRWFDAGVTSSSLDDFRQAAGLQ